MVPTMFVFMPGRALVNRNPKAEREKRGMAVSQSVARVDFSAQPAGCVGPGTKRRQKAMHRSRRPGPRAQPPVRRRSRGPSRRRSPSRLRGSTGRCRCTPAGSGPRQPEGLRRPVGPARTPAPHRARPAGPGWAGRPTALGRLVPQYPARRRREAITAPTASAPRPPARPCRAVRARPRARSGFGSCGYNLAPFPQRRSRLLTVLAERLDELPLPVLTRTAVLPAVQHPEPAITHPSDHASGWAYRLDQPRLPNPPTPI
jgi:hypothetical protein